MFSQINWQSFKEAVRHLYAAKLRSTLALLGILVGTASVVAMVSSGELATREALKQFELLGTDLLAMTLSEPEQSGEGVNVERDLTLEEAENLKRADRSIDDLAPYTQLFNLLQFNQFSTTASILGVTEDFTRIARLHLMKGRFVSKLDQYQFYCVIGNKLYEQMKQYSYHDVIGQQILVGQTIFTIIGVMGPWTENSFIYVNMDMSILVPILTSTVIGQKVAINNFLLRLNDHADIETVQQHLTQAVQQSVGEKHIFFRSAKELIAKMSKQSQIFTVFLGLIGSISLLVGGIGVMNIMLVSVVERRREIGVRLAIGASTTDVCWLFLMEAVLLSFAGGTGGVVLGTSIAYGMSLFWHWHFVFYFLPASIGFLVSTAVGIFFGLYPAYHASQLDPVQALRG